MKLDAAILQFLADTIPGITGSDWLEGHTVAGSGRPKTGVRESYIAVDLISVVASVSAFGEGSYTSVIQVGLRDAGEGWHKACVDLVDHEAEIGARFTHGILAIQAIDSFSDILLAEAQTDYDNVILFQCETTGWPL